MLRRFCLCLLSFSLAQAVAFNPPKLCIEALSHDALEGLSLATKYSELLSSTVFRNHEQEHIRVYAVDLERYEKEIDALIAGSVDIVQLKAPLGATIEKTEKGVFLKTSKPVLLMKEDVKGGAAFKGNVIAVLKNDQGAELGRLALDFDAVKKNVYVDGIYLEKEIQGRGVGSFFLKSLRDLVPDSWTLSFTSHNKETNKRLLTLMSKVQRSFAYQRIKTLEGKAASEDYYQKEVARRALELSKENTDLVWVRLLQNAGWKIDGISDNGFYPVFRCSKGEEK